jgi:hypothetical protein
VLILSSITRLCHVSFLVCLSCFIILSACQAPMYCRVYFACPAPSSPVLSTGGNSFSGCYYFCLSACNGIYVRLIHKKHETRAVLILLSKKIYLSLCCMGGVHIVWCFFLLPKRKKLFFISSINILKGKMLTPGDPPELSQGLKKQTS